MSIKMFSEKIKKHLESYKYLWMNIHKDGTWTKNNKPYKHILPKQLQKENILPFIRERFWQYYGKRELHKDFHHLNSSQALCFNLFYPLFMIDKNDLLPVVNGLNVFSSISTVSSCNFELKCSDKTSIDFSINFDSGRKIFYEIKYSESEFGSAEDNAIYHDRFNKLYYEALDGKIKLQYLTVKDLVKHYQIYRNISFAEINKTIVLFIIPANNENLVYINELLNKILEDSFKPFVKIFTIESILDLIKQYHPALYINHYTEFKVKYML